MIVRKNAKRSRSRKNTKKKNAEVIAAYQDLHTYVPGFKTYVLILIYKMESAKQQTQRVPLITLKIRYAKCRQWFSLTF